MPRPPAHPEAEARRGQADEDRRAGDAHLLARLRIHGAPRRAGRRSEARPSAASPRSCGSSALRAKGRHSLAGHRDRGAERGTARPGRANVPTVNGQYVAYTFFRVDPAWRRLPVEERAAAKDAFAEVLEELAPRFEHLRAYSTTGVRPGDGLLPLEDHRALRGSGRARRRAERDAARRLARDAVLVPRDHEGIAVHVGAQGAEDLAEELAVPRRLPVREGAPVVLPDRRGAPARDGRAHPHRTRGVPGHLQSHHVLVRDRRCRVHDRVRMRGAG